MTSAENPFATLASRSEPTPPAPVAAPAPAEQVPANINPFDKLRDQATAHHVGEPAVQGAIPEQEPVAETPPEPAPAPPLPPAPEPLPTPAPAPEPKKRAARKTAAPESAQPKAVTPPPADELTTLALTKGADQAWIELTKIIEHADYIKNRHDALAEDVKTAESEAAEAVSRAEKAQQRRDELAAELERIQQEFQEAETELTLSETARDEIISKGSGLFTEYDALTKEVEEQGDHAVKARATREAVSAYLSALTGGKSGTYGGVRVTFIDGNPYIEQVTPLPTPPGEDTNS